MSVSSDACFEKDASPAIAGTANTHLEQPRQDAASVIRKVFQSRCGSRSVQSTPKSQDQSNQFWFHPIHLTETLHSNPVKRPDSRKLRQIPRESSRQLQDDEEAQSANHHPFTPIAVENGAENERPDGSQHERDGDALPMRVSRWFASCDFHGSQVRASHPSHLAILHPEVLRNFCHRQRNGGKVKRIPHPTKTQHQHISTSIERIRSRAKGGFRRRHLNLPPSEPNPKHKPVVRIELPQDGDGVLHLGPWRPEGSSLETLRSGGFGSGSRTTLEPCCCAFSEWAGPNLEGCGGGLV